MQQVFLNLGALRNNPHVGYPLIAILVCEILRVWFPELDSQFIATEKILGAYAMLSAGNSGPSLASEPAKTAAIKPIV